MATKKSTSKRHSSKKTSSGSGPKSKGIVRKKMKRTMHEFKHHELESGRSGKKVKNPKQAIAIGLSEARRSGADVPPAPKRKKTASKARKKSTAKKSTGKKSTAKRSGAKKSTAKKSGSRKR
jgi:Family of unknown function (DUF6496)